MEIDVFTKNYRQLNLDYRNSLCRDIEHITNYKYDRINSVLWNLNVKITYTIQIHYVKIFDSKDLISILIELEENK